MIIYNSNNNLIIYVLRNSDLKMRMHNDVLMQLERNFIDPLGLPGRPFDRLRNFMLILRHSSDMT